MMRLTRWALIAAIMAGVTGCSQHRVRLTGGQSRPRSEDFVFYVQPRTIAAGDAAVLHWSIRGATKILIEAAPVWRSQVAPLGTFDASGTLKVSPLEDTVYLISCEGSTSYTCASATVHVVARASK